MAGVIQFEQDLSWIPIINAHYHIGVDGLSMPMVLLSALLGFLVILVILAFIGSPQKNSNSN